MQTKEYQHVSHFCIRSIKLIKIHVIKSKYSNVNKGGGDSLLPEL